MRVNQIQQPASVEQVQNTAPTDGSFKFMLASHVEEAELQERLTNLMAEITTEGEKLAKKRDVKDMRHYRGLVKEFLNEVVTRSHSFSRENFLDRRGRHRVYGIIRLVDENLDQLAQELMKEDWPEQVTIREGGTFTQDIFYSFKGYSHLLVLDVVHCGGKPGTLYRLTEDALIKDDKQRLSIHDIDLIDSLRMAEKLFGTKSELLVLGVEPKDYVTWNIGLSDDVQAVFPEFLALARKEIGEWLKRYGNGETRA